MYLLKKPVRYVWILPPIHDGGFQITGYIIECRRKDQGRYRKVQKVGIEAYVNGYPARQCFVVEKLEVGFMYYFRVLSVTEIGVGRPGEHERFFIQKKDQDYGDVTIRSGDGYAGAKSRSFIDIFNFSPLKMKLL